MKRSYDDHLLKLDRVPDILGLEDIIRQCNDDRESWNVQVFRSIDSNSVKGFPKDPKDGTQWNLLCGKNVLIDMSIQAAYVHAIRSAQHYIYIENQYFLGSSYNWMLTGTWIVSKIRANERFAAYIVIPMWPEGDPKSLPMQRILFWQYKTMQMMYEMIYKALQETGMDSMYEPQDFLNFFCLGNREVSNEICVANSTSSSNGNTAKTPTEKNRRFMIYVHSKGMIVDDEYVIIGSANINQRSMEGTRDTEIAMEHISRTIHGLDNILIHTGRMSLWAEHLGTVEDPLRTQRALSFAADEVTEMKSHLLKYPLQVDKFGVVNPLPGYETFPDLGGKVMGTFSGIQENLTI
ncbi:Phospholipase D beta 1 [Bienertia sinuspersici]